MACVNIIDWTPDQVAEWMRGLHDALLPYVHFFLNNGIDGKRLLFLSLDDLPNLHVNKLGHQELILEAIELLKHFHCYLDVENLQSLALQVSCKARSLFNDLKTKMSSELEKNGKQERVTTSILSTVANMVVSVKSLISWLDRSPFNTQEEYNIIRNLLLHITVELATNALRDRFAEHPVDVIRNCCLRLCEICDKIIQESADPMIIQPASLDIATIKKKPDEEVGLFIRSSFSGIHHIGEIKYESPAHFCGRIEDGDEVIQVNYQTVIGWQLKKLVTIMRENPTEVILTLKKRPRHANLFGQALSRSTCLHCHRPSPFLSRSQWREVPAGRPPLVTRTSTAQQTEQKNPLISEGEDVDDDDDSAFLPENSEEGEHTSNVYQLFIPRPRAVVQRRATVTGASPNTSRPPVSIDQLWLHAKREQVMRSVSHDPTQLESLSTLSDEITKLGNTTPTKEESDEEVGNFLNETNELNLPPRPHTCIGSSPVLDSVYTIRQFKSLEGPRSEFGSDSIQVIKDTSVDSGIGEQSASMNKHQEKENLSARSSDLEITKQNESKHKASEQNSKVVIDKRDPIKEDSKESESLSVPGTPTPSIKSATGSTLGIDSNLSYQVFIAGGVPQIAAATDTTRSPKQSPVLRAKGRTWEFSNRRISCKDLGMGDCQGWLYKRKDHKQLLSGPKWMKRWCVLKNRNFYWYKDKDDEKAEGLIYLPAFTVSPAAEIKSKKFAFKVHHTGTAFYYASDSQQDMSKWMNKMGLAAIAYDETNVSSANVSPSMTPTSMLENIYYSETEDDGEETLTDSGITESEDSTPAASASDSGISNILRPKSEKDSIDECSISPAISAISNNTVFTDTVPSCQNSSVELNSDCCKSNNTLPKCSPGTTRKFLTPAIEPSDMLRKANSCDYYVDKIGDRSSLESFKDKRKTSDGALYIHQARSHTADRKMSVPMKKMSLYDRFPVSTNISSISLRSVRSNASAMSSTMSVSSANSESSEVFPNKDKSYRRSYFRRDRAAKNPSEEKLFTSSNLSPAFEMNLDSSSALAEELESQASYRLSKPSGYFSKVSPRALKKLSSQSRSEKKRKSRTTMWFDEEFDYASEFLNRQEDTPRFTTSSAQTDLHCIPKLSSVSAFGVRHFGSAQRKLSARLRGQSKSATWNSRHSQSASSLYWDEKRGMTFDSRWNSMPSEKYYQTKLTVQISGGDGDDALSKMPMKPAMGVSMIGKRRSSSQCERSMDSKLPSMGVPVSLSVTSQGTQTDNDDELTCLFASLSSNDLTYDVNYQRKSVLEMQRNEHMLLLQSLEIRLKAKEDDLKMIDALLDSTTIDSETLRDWIENYGYLCQMQPTTPSIEVTENE